MATTTPFGQNLYLLHFIVLGLAISSLVFSWIYIYEMGLLYMSTRHATHMNQVQVYQDTVRAISQANFRLKSRKDLTNLPGKISVLWKK